MNYRIIDKKEDILVIVFLFCFYVKFIFIIRYNIFDVLKYYGVVVIRVIYIKEVGD